MTDKALKAANSIFRRKAFREEILALVALGAMAFVFLQIVVATIWLFCRMFFN